MKEIIPTRYKIHLEPDLERFSFDGTVEIHAEISEPTDTIYLDARELTASSAHVRIGSRQLEASCSVSEEAQNLTLTLPEQVQGEAVVVAAFSGTINDKMAGFYRSRFVLDGQEGYVAATQFEEVDARRAFPCFDEPGLKAVFDVEMVVPDEHLAIANTPVLEERSLGDGRRLVRFEPTPRMSTYLLFFGVGPYDVVEDASRRIPIRVLAAPGRARYGERAITYARESLQYLEEYTGVYYPIGKMDLIALPDFAYGAMENYGAITYRENLLLYYPGVTSQRDLTSIAEVTAHEVAHMWFGNLVSPSTWQFMWLNEAFATYFGNVISQATHPEWAAMHRFVSGAVHGAMSRDSLVETIPIELPGGEMVEVDPSSAPILYSKAASILRMFHAYLGDGTFREAVRAYLSRFAYGIADTDEFLTVFAEAAGSAGDGDGDGAPGVDLAAAMRSWIRQPGFPLVTARRDGTTLRLRQERFTYLGNAPATVWRVPITGIAYTSDGETPLNLMLDAAEATVQLPEGCTCVKLNTNQAGFYRVAYDRENAEALGAMAATKRLSVFDRHQLLSDLEAHVLSGATSVGEYLDVAVRHFADETELLVVERLAGALLSFQSLLPERSDEISSVGRKVLSPIATRLGMDPRDGDSYTDVLLRETVMWALFRFDDPDVTEHYRMLFRRMVDGEEVPADQQRLALRIGAARDAGTLDWFRGKLEDAETPEVQKRSLLSAMGWLQDAAILRNALAYTLERVTSQNRVHVVAGAAENPVGREFLWEWYVANESSLSSLHPYHFASVVSVVVPSGGIGHEPAVRSHMEAYIAEHTTAPARTIRMSLERLQVAVALREGNLGE
jgi:aminopeptidase N